MYFSGLACETPMSTTQRYWPDGWRSHTVTKLPNPLGSSVFPFARNSQLPVVYPRIPLDEISPKFGAQNRALSFTGRTVQKALAEVLSGTKTTASFDINSRNASRVFLSRAVFAKERSVDTSLSRSD